MVTVTPQDDPQKRMNRTKDPTLTKLHTLTHTLTHKVAVHVCFVCA
jgi:hypothetical protein